MMIGDYAANIPKSKNTSLIFDSNNNVRITNKAHSYTGKIGQSLISFVELDLSGILSISSELYDLLYVHHNDVKPPQELCDYATDKWNEISGIHPYLYDHFEDNSLLNATDPDMNHFIITRLFSNATWYAPQCLVGSFHIEQDQKEYRDIIDYCLNPDTTKESSHEPLFQYMQAHKTYIPEIHVKYAISHDGIEEIYPLDNRKDACFLELLYCIKAGIKYRKCNHCNRYFDVTKYPNTLYCDRIMPGEDKPCDIIGRTRKFNQDHKNDYHGKYRSANNRNSAKLLPDKYNEWLEMARNKKDLVIQGQLSEQEYIEWLNSDKKTNRSRGEVPKHQPTRH
jgi:hypothetical protein